VTTERRAVRATARFFEDLDRQLGAERGADGQPSTNDFQVFDLFRIVETFATQFDELPKLIPGRADYRIVIGVGVVVARFAVIGQLAPDGAVELGSSTSTAARRGDPHERWSLLAQIVTRMVSEVGGTGAARVGRSCQWICRWIGAKSIGRGQHRATPTDT